MPIASTAKLHFDQDLDRAQALITHADGQAIGLLREDIARASWMMGVGAADAYFCDAYADFIARTLQAKQLQPAINLTPRLANLKIPVAALIRSTASESWRWRMAARELIEKESVLDLATVKGLFNHFFRRDFKLFSPDSFDSWLLHRDGKQRLFGISKTNYRQLLGGALHTAREQAKEQFEERFEYIFQRRHDCIHNCDRVRMAVNVGHIRRDGYVQKVLEDIEFLVTRCHEAFRAEFPEFLTIQGFNAVTRNRVCQ
jgi:hypothetical protein